MEAPGKVFFQPHVRPTDILAEFSVERVLRIERSPVSLRDFRSLGNRPHGRKDDTVQTGKEWNNFLPVLLAGRCYLGLVAEQPNPALRARFEGFGAGTFMTCPVIDNRNRMLGALFVTWDVRDLPPTGDALLGLMKYALGVGAQVASALDLRGRMSPFTGGPEAQ